MESPSAGATNPPMTSHAIAAGHDLTAEAGAAILGAGGTAVDAAIAAAAMAMVVEPVLAGLLGGGFLMVREPGGRCRCLDTFVQTPKAKRPEAELDFREVVADFGTATQAFHIGAASVAAPGLALGLAEAHIRYGRMPFADLLAPAIRAAREGVTVTGFQASLARIVAPILKDTPAARALHAPEGDLLGEGAHFANPALGDVLEVFGHEGPRFVQEGEVAAALLSLMEAGGHLTRADLAAYRPAWREPVAIQRGGAAIALAPPPSLGGALIAFSLALMDQDPAPVDKALAFEMTDRARVEAALDEDPAEGLQTLLAPGLIARFRRGLTGRPVASRGTTQISVVDAEGIGASLTLSNGEGCGTMVPGTGIMPNNMLGEEDLVPQGWHRWPVDRRLGSMMAPMAVTWPTGRMAMLGSGGSNRIRTALSQVLLGILDRGLPLDEAIERPRLHVEGDGRRARLDAETVDLLESDLAVLRRAYPEMTEWAARSMFFGGVHAVLRDAGGGVAAAGDPRRAGAVRIG